jgi:hypothetical protein
MWEDRSYGWVVTCKNYLCHPPRDLIDKHKIPLRETEGAPHDHLSKGRSPSCAAGASRRTFISRLT